MYSRLQFNETETFEHRRLRDVHGEDRQRRLTNHSLRGLHGAQYRHRSKVRPQFIFELRERDEPIAVDLQTHQRGRLSIQQNHDRAKAALGLFAVVAADIVRCGEAVRNHPFFTSGTDTAQTVHGRGACASKHTRGSVVQFPSNSIMS